jgi:predicted phosphodiesterase
MRYGVLADVHGNLHALRAVVDVLERAGVDRFLVAGDLVGYGPEPNRCVEVVAALDSLCVAGNHDLIVLGRLSDDRCIPMARETLRWSRQVLSDDALAFLSQLPLRCVAPGGVVVAHGSLDDPQAYTTRPDEAERQLAGLGATADDARLLILGHTHRPWAFRPSTGRLPTRRPVALARDEPMLLNPGAVGQSRELRARARCMLLDLDAGQATFLALPYDISGCRAALVRAGLPARSYHLRPSPLGAARRVVRGVRRRVSAHR